MKRGVLNSNLFKSSLLISIISSGLLLSIIDAQAKVIDNPFFKFYSTILPPPAPSTPDLAGADDTGISNTDNITSQTTNLTLSGTSDPSVTIKILNGATQIATTAASGGGTWTVDITLAEGTHSLTAIANDGADSPASGALVIIVDTSDPSAPSTPDLDPSDDSGTSNSDDVTNQTTGLTFSGTAEANSTVELFRSAISLGTTTTSGAGNWTINVSIPAGSHSITAEATDEAGNTSPASSALAVTIDTTPPAVPSVPDLSSADDTGVSNSDNITRNTTNLTFSGTSVAGIDIELFNGATSLGTTTASGGGTWTIDLNLSQGVYNITARATDIAGNFSTSSGLSVTIDTTPPTLTGAFIPADNAINAATNTTFTLNFNSNVTVSTTGSVTGSQDKFQVIRNTGNNLTVDVGRGSGDIAISGPQVIVTNSGSDLAVGTLYYINIGNKVFSDVAGNDFAGIGTIAGLAADNSTWNFTTSNGVSVTAPSISTCASDYTSLGDIIISEGGGNDINASSGGVYTLILNFSNTDYRFNPESGNGTFTASRDIVSITESITPTTATFTITFDNVGTGGSNRAKNDVDQITLSGLEVSSGGALVASNIYVSGSSTIPIASITTGPAGTPMATISPAAAGAPPTFTVQALPGDPAVDPNQTQFSTSSKGIQLVGSPAGGVFEGNGVVFNFSSGFYTFNPSATGVSTNRVTYTYTPGGGCPVSTFKDFIVFFSNIGGLSSTYCSNATGSTMTVNSSYITTTYGAGSYLAQFIYYNPNLGYPAGVLPISPTNNFFDPKSSNYNPSYNFYGNGVWIGFHVNNSLNVRVGEEWTFVSVSKAPTVSFVISTNSFCENGTAVSITGNPPPALSDVFSGQGINNPARMFDPTNVTTIGSPITLSYNYTDPQTGCSNIGTTQVTVFPQPSQVPHSSLYLYFANTQAGTPATTYACQNESFDYIVTALNGSPIYPTDYRYNWYSNVSLTSLMYSQSWAFYPYTVNTNTPSTTSFYVTQVVNGCESPGREIFATVNQAAIVDAGPPTATICATDDLILSTLNPSVSGSATPAGSYWVGGDGTFFNASNNPIAGTAFFSVATKYRPGPNDKLNQSINLILYSNDPDGSGPCIQVSDYVALSITPSPTAVAGPDAVYCADDKIFLSGYVDGANAQTTVAWSVLPGGGTIESPTSLTTSYTPSLSQKNTGATLTFTMTTNDPDGAGPCTASMDDVIITLNQESTIDAGVDAAFCSDETIQLNATKPTGSGASTWNWTGGAGGLNDPTSLTPVYSFVPAELGQTIEFTITTNDPDGSGPCLSRSDKVLIKIKIDPPPPVINPEFKYCVTPGIAGATNPLSASGQQVKWYNNPGLTGAPSADPFSTGITTLADIAATFYATSTNEGCESLATPSTIIVNPAPMPMFTVANFCLGDQTQFTDTSPALVYNNGGSGSIVSWSYDFGNGITTPPGSGPLPVGTNATTGTHENPAHRYANINTYNPTLTLKTSDDCSNTASALTLFNNPIRIGPVPVANFSYSNVCKGDNTLFDYKEGENPAASDMKTFSWNFGDPSSPSNSSNIDDPSHIFTAYDTYNVTLTLTSNLDCVDAITKPVGILPYITDFSTPYIESFETNAHGFAHEGLALDFRSNTIPDSWSLLTPTGPAIPIAYDGSKAWMTKNGATYADNERSVLNGPCVDFTDLPRPALSFAHWNNTQNGQDGVYLEVSNDGGNSWQVLGDTQTGLRWYNQSSISGLVTQNNVVNGGTIGQSLNQYGFSGNTSGWIISKFSLDNVASTKTRFRFVFGSNGENPTGVNLEGFAMDYFKLETRNKVILAENFTNASETPNNNDFVSFKQSITNTEIVKIQYHTSLNGSDNINEQNPADPNSRVAFYGITNSANLIPRAYIDGYSEGDYTLPWVNSYSSLRALEDAPFRLTASTISTDPGAIEIVSSAIALQNIPATTRPVAYIAIVEKSVGTNQYVLRKMLPSAAGYPLAPPNTLITKDQLFTFPNARWEIDNHTINQSNLAVIFFIQDQMNNLGGYKQVFQAAVITNPTITPGIITSIEDPTFAEKIMVYPNPVNHELNVVLPGQVISSTPLHLIDAQGRVVYEGNLNPGEFRKAIATTEFSGGMYILQINNKENVIRKKVMVVHQGN